VTFTGCNIHNNEALWGGGAYIAKGTVTFSNCSINNNQADEQGGGLFVVDGDDVSIDNCDISSNQANDDYYNVYLDHGFVCASITSTSAGVGWGPDVDTYSFSPNCMELMFPE